MIGQWLQAHAQAQPQAPAWTLVATAEVPLMDGRRLEMLKALMASDSTTYLSMVLPSLAKDAEAHKALLRCANMEEALQDKTGRTSGLLDHIQPAVLASLITGTLAWDHYHGVFNSHREHRDSDLPGTYAVSVQVAGRQGAWMSATEVLAVRDHLHKYILGAEHYYVFHGWLDPALHQHVQLLDGMVGSANSNGPPKWATDAAGVERLRALQDTLQRMAIGSLTRDQSGRTWLKQCPIYVGCSSGPMKQRYEQHQGFEDKSLQMNRLLGVLVCCMKSENLRPEVVAVPVLPIFEQEDLPLSEILVTGLARSMCVTGGLNCTGPGANNSPIEASLLASSLSVLSLAGDLLERVERSNKQIQAHLQDASNKKMLADLEKKVYEMGRKVDDLREKNKECLERRAAVDRELKEMRGRTMILDAETAAMEARTARILAALAVLEEADEGDSNRC